MTTPSFSRVSTAALSQQSTLANTTPPPSSRALEQAIGHFRARLKGDQLLDFRNTTYKDLCWQIELIQQKQEARKNMMNLARIRSFLEAMEQFGKVIEVFLNLADMVAFIWGPMKFLLLVGSTPGWSPNLTI